MKTWDDYTALALAGAAKDAGWIIAMIAICLATFTVSSVLVKWGLIFESKVPGGQRGNQLRDDHEPLVQKGNSNFGSTVGLRRLGTKIDRLAAHR